MCTVQGHDSKPLKLLIPPIIITQLQTNMLVGVCSVQDYDSKRSGGFHDPCTRRSFLGQMRATRV
jgi:hypothetical protein